MSGARSYALAQIHGDLIEPSWHLLRPLLASACDPVATTNTPESFRERVEQNTMMLWLVYDPAKPLPPLGVAATSIRDTNKGKTVVVEAIAGHDMQSWFAGAVGEFEALARKHGIERIEIEGRRGWLRKLPDFRLMRVVMEKEL